MIRVEEDIKQPMTPSARFSVSTVQQTIQELNTDTANGLSFADVDFRTKRYGRYVDISGQYHSNLL